MSGHLDSTASARAADALGARAFTIGSSIHLSSGESPSNTALMAHETAHTIQQRGIAPRGSERVRDQNVPLSSRPPPPGPANDEMRSEGEVSRLMGLTS
jgi:hypothetical protein